MPGVRIGMEVSNTHSGSGKQPFNDIALRPAIKDEDDDEIFGGDSDSNGDDGNDYKPRPQLPQPNVNMRSLGSLISEWKSS
jgi:hypothetical protein